MPEPSGPASRVPLRLMSLGVAFIFGGEAYSGILLVGAGAVLHVRGRHHGQPQLG